MAADEQGVGAFHAFLSYNSADSDAVEDFARRLQEDGLACWLDRWDLVPGEPSQQGIETGLMGSASCVVFIGPDGLGPWHNEEVRIAVRQRVDRKGEYRVIPVLLPGRNALEEIPAFLGVTTWVQFQSIDDADAYERLKDGILGRTARQRLLEEQPAEAIVRSPAFHYGEIVDSDHFIGRESELRTACEYLAEGRSFLLKGNIRAGKTSFCFKLEEEAYGDSSVGVALAYLNAQSIVDVSLEAFLQHTLLAIFGAVARGSFGASYRDLCSPVMNPDAISAEEAGAFGALRELYRLARPALYEVDGRSPTGMSAGLFVEMTSAIAELIGTMDYKRIAIVYDEASRLCDGHDQSLQSLKEALSGQLEILEQAGICTVCTAAPEMADPFEYLKSLFSTWLTLGPFESIGTMEKLIAQYYFNDASRHAELPVTEEALGRIWNATGGKPFPIQLLAGHSFAHAKSSMSSVVELPHVQSALSVLASERPREFNIVP